MKLIRRKAFFVFVVIIYIFIVPVLLKAPANSPSSLFETPYSSDTYVDFYAISESDHTTRWVLQGAEISPIEDFHDDINTNYWNLVDVSQHTMQISLTPTHDAMTTSFYPDDPYGTQSYIQLYSYPDPKTYAWVNDPSITNYLTSNYTDNSELKIYHYSEENSGYIEAYSTSNFDETTITWNNQPDAIALLETTFLPSTLGWKTIGLGSNRSVLWYRLHFNDTCYQLWRSKEYSGTDYDPQIIHYLSKNYFGDGYMYMQTNTTETLALLSQDYGTHYTLNSGDYFEIDFQTNSDSKIELLLYKNSSLNKTLTLSPNGNTNFNRRTAQISVSETVEFDQLKIKSTFEDRDYVKIYDIKTYKYTVVGDYADFYVGSKRTHVVNLTSDLYNLRIFDEGTTVIDENITIGTSDFFYVYSPIEAFESRLTLFNTDGTYLEFTDYHINVNRSLNGEWNDFWLLDNIFSVDVETYVYIAVYDRFNSLIKTFTKIASSYIDLEIEVYQLQIKNLMEQKTTININSSYIYPVLSGDSIYFHLSKAHYTIGYHNTENEYQEFSIYLNSNQAYELNRSKMCFLTYTNQRGQYLPFNQFKTYINSSLLYYNVFYKYAGASVNITITDLFDIQIHSELYTVVSGDNYVPLILTVYSLKVMNQQGLFNHVNITRDSNYYESPYSWSEWIAPGELIKFGLFAGYYKINLTDYEHSTYSYYAYTLNGDDILLISSDNTLSSVVSNIQNVNTTIGNQITNVEINLSNQNTAINNSIINIDINLSNVNSTLGDLLVNLNLDIENIANNISSLYVFTNNSFINLNNNMNSSFIYMENNIIAINESVSNLVIGVSNDIYLINGTISTLISSLENNLLLMNVSLNTALFDLDTTLEAIGNNITNNFILLNNSINLTNNNINDSRLAILNNLALINNSISTLISQVYSSVYLVNNSIYNAVLDVGTALSLVNNTISGNLTIILEQNEYLTELYQMTMFSDLLDFTNIGYNYSLLEEQIDIWTFVNLYRNQSIEVHLRYQDEIEKIIIGADDSIEQYLPNSGVEYNLWSGDQEEYLDEWEELDSETKTVDFGFYQEEVPEVPGLEDILASNTVGQMMFYFFLIVGIIFLVSLIARGRDRKKEKGSFPTSRYYKKKRK